MPKTKLDRLTLSPAQVRCRIIRSAASRAGFFRDRDVAEILGISQSCLSNRYSGIRPWTIDEIAVMERRLEMTNDEIVRFIRGRAV